MPTGLEPVTFELACIPKRQSVVICKRGDEVITQITNVQESNLPIVLPRPPDSLDAIIGGWIPSRQSPCFVKVQRSCLPRKPPFSTAMPSTVGTRQRFSGRFADAHAASGRPEARYLRVLIVRMYSQQAVELCVVIDQRRV